METRRAGGVMVHPFRPWSKRQRRVGGQWQPTSKLEFCQIVKKKKKKKDSLPSWEYRQAVTGGAEI